MLLAHLGVGSSPFVSEDDLTVDPAVVGRTKKLVSLRDGYGRKNNDHQFYYSMRHGYEGFSAYLL